MEPLFRLSSLILEDGAIDIGFWRELGAAVVSPPTGFNRLAFGVPVQRGVPEPQPGTFTRVRLGATLNEQTSGSGADNNFSRNEASLDYFLAYGSRKDGYTYDRPFDYFDVQFTAVSNKNVIENLMTRGLLYGKKYEAGDNYRGCGAFTGARLHLAAGLPRLQHGPFPRYPPASGGSRVR